MSVPAFVRMTEGERSWLIPASSIVHVHPWGDGRPWCVGDPPSTSVVVRYMQPGERWASDVVQPGTLEEWAEKLGAR